jgi:S1-C subfamily serine protease
MEALGAWDRVVRQELKSAGFTAGGDPTNLFEEQQSSDLQLGALITDVRVRACSISTLAGDSFGGSATMNVEWQVYSVAQGKVVARVLTHGGMALKQSKQGTMLALTTGAFGDNVRRLIADPEFRQLVLANPESAAPAVMASPMRLTFAPGATPVPIAMAVKSVVTIYGPDGSGSGVVVAEGGYILTNHHVAGSNGQVRVRWADGSSTVGDVVRSDGRRDVALVRTTPKAAALPIRPNPVQLGDSVFAVGSPLGDAFQNTVTKGIVSASRTYDGMPFIQSDVAVTHGNSGGPLLDDKGDVVGLTVSGAAPNGAPVGLNLFIPIDDALRALSLEAAPQTAAAPPKLTSKR